MLSFSTVTWPLQRCEEQMYLTCFFHRRLFGRCCKMILFNIRITSLQNYIRQMALFCQVFVVARLDVSCDENASKSRRPKLQSIKDKTQTRTINFLHTFIYGKSLLYFRYQNKVISPLINALLISLTICK